MPEDVIWVVTDEPPQLVVPDGARDAQRGTNPFEEPKSIETPIKRRIPVPVEKLEAGVTDFLELVGRVFSKAQRSAGEIAGMELDEIELSVEVNGEGELSLLGNGVKAGGKGAMTLKFKTVKQ